MTILLVEDHADTRQAIRMWLEAHGHSVIEAQDYKSAVTAAARPFDILLCDLQLPDGDGWSLLQQLRKQRPVAALAVSGHCSPNDLARSKAAGFLMHLPKPFDGHELNAALASVALEAGKDKQQPPQKRAAKRSTQSSSAKA